MKKLFMFVGLLAFFGCTFAHQPRLIFQQPIGQVVTVENPEISQAFYGILSWQEDVYQINSDTGFLLYVNIVVPNVSWSRTDFFVDIIQGNNAVYTRLDGKSFVWTDFFEPFAGDDYLKGPEREQQVPAWRYTIRVSNPDNQGKYSLAIGKIESFPLNETIHTYKVLPALKVVFFEKPRYTMFRSVVGWGLLVLIVLVIGIVRWSIRIIRHIRKNR